MRFASILYLLFCAAVVLLFTAATMRSYSPFADGGRPLFVSGVRGPTHK